MELARVYSEVALIFETGINHAILSTFSVGMSLHFNGDNSQLSVDRIVAVKQLVDK